MALLSCLLFSAGLAFLGGCVSPAVPRTEIAGSPVVTYPAPKGSSLNSAFTVKVRPVGGDWQNVATYRMNVDAVVETNHKRKDTSAAFFDFSGPVEVSITYRRAEIRTARIRPLSFGIIPEVSKRTLVFSLTQPRNLSIEVNDDIFGNLQLFANPLEMSRPAPSAPNVLYYGSGIHAVPGGKVKLLSGQTLYLAGGAILRAEVDCINVENVRVIGRGMIDQENHGGVQLFHAKNVDIEGIYTPHITIGNSQDVAVRNVKCISYWGYGDGMNIFSSDRVLIDGVFNRNSDDCITVYGTRGQFLGGVKGVVVKNSTLWADVAHPILIGTHGNTKSPDTLEDLTFSNIDILDHMERQLDYQGCMSLNAGDSNLIRNVLFEDIRVEDFRCGQLVNLRVFYNRKYCTSPGRGIEDVTFRNITYTGSHAEQSVICGYDETRKVRNVTFENLSINGVVIADDMKKPGWFKTSDMARFFVGDYVEGLKFVASGGAK
ncbi:MAG: endo-polygalacturonase [Verrucomicrobia bacterium]|nr:endo-polygalacturonase [Verrucomicrobiota bacterium]